VWKVTAANALAWVQVERLAEQVQDTIGESVVKLLTVQGDTGA